MKFTLVQKISASLLIAVWLVWGVNMLGDLLMSDPGKAAKHVAKTTPKEAAPAPTAKESAPAPKEAAPMEAPKTAGALSMLASADAAKGAKVFGKCRGCHTPDKGGPNRVGPNLWDIVGKAKAGDGFKFSGALKKLGGDWTYEDLDTFLTKPKSFAPGTKMTFSGVKKDGDRANLIAYLRSLSDSPKPLP